MKKLFTAPELRAYEVYNKAGESFYCLAHCDCCAIEQMAALHKERMNDLQAQEIPRDRRAA